MPDRLTELAQLFDDLSDRDAIRAAVQKSYASDAYFQDPIQKQQGIEAISRMYLQMGKLFSGVEFLVLRSLEKESTQVIEWEMTCHYKLKPFSVTVEGTTWLELDDDGKISSHIDYWDLSTFMRRTLWPFS